MAVPTVQSQGWILALFIRDDNERFLLGSGGYEFKSEQLHFAANNFDNDVVEIQGNDGALLAGQARRASVQSFDGYVGDATVGQSSVEQYRRDFFAFFQKNHFFTVVYVMCDGSAVQRKRGYIVDAPEVKELWQLFPEYHVALNFEDVNYYTYSENDEGEEIFSNYATIPTSTTDIGGLVWEDLSITGQQVKTGTSVAFTQTIANQQIDDLIIYGQTEQNGTPTTSFGRTILTTSGTEYLTVSNDKSESVTYTVNFGSVVLCKIGDAQDYIYKNGDDYYLHKETATTTASAGATNTTIADMIEDSEFYSYYGGSVSGTTITYDGELPDENTIYYQTTSTSDTVITDSDLISSLDTIFAMTSYEGATTFTFEAYTDPYVVNPTRVPAIITVYLQVYVGGGVEWDQYGAVWEAGGGSPVVTITNNSIANVAPIITITGLSENPQFSNLTTNQTLVYNGNVTSTQTLVIDVARKTALLNGASVISRLSGEWVTLAPGANRLSYTTDNSTVPNAKIEWQEVVG